MPTRCVRIVPAWPALLVALLLCTAATGCKGRSARSSKDLLQGDVGPSTLALHGKLIFEDTPRMARAYAGNQLSCDDCHLQGGTADYAVPMIDVAGVFPRYSRRAGHTITLVDRIQECFVRNENGTPPPASSPEMKALVGYIDWLSRTGVKGHPYAGRGLVQLPVLSGDAHTGQRLYARSCRGCHGSDGAGMPPSLPPLWGPGSFSTGASLSQVPRLAAFLQHNMPRNSPGSLTPQQAYDIAAYIETKPRPKFNTAYREY